MYVIPRKNFASLTLAQMREREATNPERNLVGYSVFGLVKVRRSNMARQAIWPSCRLSEDFAGELKLLPANVLLLRNAM
jgi:hypothetical protein